jgi:hypothetical protein
VLCDGDILASLYVESFLTNDASFWPVQILSRRMNKNKNKIYYSLHNDKHLTLDMYGKL